MNLAAKTNSGHDTAAQSGDPTADASAHTSADLVSVIIPAYNVAPYIGEALDSVFAQTYRHFEVIVVNDGSPDTPALEEMLQPYRDRIHYLVQENKGLSGARNTGMRAASGTYIALLDADDIWLPHYLEEQTKYLREHPQRDLVYCDAEFFGDSPEAGILYMDLCPSSGEADFEGLISRRCHVFVSVMARRAVMEQVGSFDEALRSCEDFDYWLRLTAAGFTIGYYRKVLVHYRKHSASLSANGVRMAESRITVLGNALKACKPGSERAVIVHGALQKTTAELQLLKGKHAMVAGDVEAALTHLSAANEYYRSNKIRVAISLVRLAPSAARGLFLLRNRIFFRPEGGSF